jgi:hypothetical protein
MDITEIVLARAMLPNSCGREDYIREDLLEEFGPSIKV